MTGDAPARAVTLTRRELTEPAVLSRIETVGGRKVGYVRLPRFARGPPPRSARRSKRLRAKGAQALVLDLRQDPGGLVTEAVGVAGVFLPSGTPVVTTEGLHSPRETLKTSGDPAAGKLPLVVLVDQNSASASEIVAGALRDADRASSGGGPHLRQGAGSEHQPAARRRCPQVHHRPLPDAQGYDLAKRGLPPA